MRQKKIQTNEVTTEISEGGRKGESKQRQRGRETARQHRERGRSKSIKNTEAENVRKKVKEKKPNWDWEKRKRKRNEIFNRLLFPLEISHFSSSSQHHQCPPSPPVHLSDSAVSLNPRVPCRCAKSGGSNSCKIALNVEPRLASISD